MSITESNTGALVPLEKYIFSLVFTLKFIKNDMF